MLSPDDAVILAERRDKFSIWIFNGPLNGPPGRGLFTRCRRHHHRNFFVERLLMTNLCHHYLSFSLHLIFGKSCAWSRALMAPREIYSSVSRLFFSCLLLFAWSSWTKKFLTFSVAGSVSNGWLPPPANKTINFPGEPGHSAWRKTTGTCVWSRQNFQFSSAPSNFLDFERKSRGFVLDAGKNTLVPTTGFGEHKTQFNIHDKTIESLV